MKKKSASQSAFFKLRVLVAVLLCFAAITLGLFAFGKAWAQPKPSAKSPQPLVRAQYRGVMPVVKFDISPPLRSMKPLPAKECTLRENEEQGPTPLGPVGRVVPDPVVQRVMGKVGIPEPIISFDGNSNLCGCSPPDPNGAVGPNNVVTMANLHFQIFDKSGNSLFGPAANNTLWSGFGGPCEIENAGDPIVIYDQLADRWLLSQFTADGPTFFECVALSQTNDPTGSYFRWAISTGTNFPDYPKAGMWPDAYYFSTREFVGQTFVGVGAYALDRAQALAGDPNPTVVGFLVPPGGTPYNVGDGLLPSDLDGTTPPPGGNANPNYFVGSMDDNGPYGAPQDALTLWEFDYDESTPANSTFVMTNTLPTAAFNSVMGGGCAATRQCIPQPNTSNEIDHLGYRQRPLFRFAYRNFGTHESLVTNQSVSAGNGPNGEVSGIRWWELRSPGTGGIIFQEGTYAPGLTDGIHRWMGSIAMNSLGDIALGYSASNGTNPALFPSSFYTARHDGDPPGQMTLGEGSVICGTGSQTGSPRWGDYTAIDVDPTDDETFWYINQYVPTTSSIGWRLRIGAFNLTTGPEATPCPIGPTPTPSPTPTPPPGVCQYTFTTGSDPIVPGDTNTGNNTDDGDTFIPLPFSFQLYDQTYNGVNVNSNGRLDFVCINEPLGYLSACLPAPPNVCPYDYTIFGLWTDYRTDVVGDGCANFASGCGIFTSVSGSAPNRVFNIEWRVVYFNDQTQTANFEVRLYENDPNQRFDVIFGTVQPGSDQLYVSGVQGPGVFTQDFCDANPPAAGSRTYTCPGGTPTPTPTPTATPTVTPTATPSVTPSATPTATPRATPRPRPTPHPRPTPP
jgi:hypothetical protein